MIDASEENVEERFRTIDTELALYGAGLDERPQAIVLNKIDLLPEPPEFPVEDERIVDVFRVSCATGAGIDELKLALFRLCPAAPEPVFEEAPELPDFLEYRPAAACAPYLPALSHRPGLPHRRRGAAGRGARGRAQGRRSPQGPGSRDRRGRAGVGVVGVFGGRFDPPHLGHVALARAAVERFGIDDLRVSVVADAAHKGSEAPPADRLAMARLAFAELGATVELEEHRYTVDALEAAGVCRPDLPDRRRRARRFPHLEAAGAGARAGTSRRRHPARATRPSSTSARIEPFELEPHPVSSSEIRERARSGESIDGLVAPAVGAYIREHGLYVRDSRVH